jgi:hypothetical protein
MQTGNFEYDNTVSLPTPESGWLPRILRWPTTDPPGERFVASQEAHPALLLPRDRTAW